MPSDETIPTLSQIRTHYDRLSWLYWAVWGEHIHHGLWETSEDTANTVQERLVHHVAESASIQHGASVLDVGCGLGGSALWLARHLNCQVHGITISPVQVRIATLLARARGLSSRVRFEVMDANDLHLQCNCFDAVWIIECSEHLCNRPEFFKRSAEVLKRGGTLALCAWMQGDRCTTEHELLRRQICRAMLCPSLATQRIHEHMLSQAGFSMHIAEDLTDRVACTWSHCTKLLDRSGLRFLQLLASAATRRFIAAMPLMQQAFQEGAIRYVLLIAKNA